MIEIEIGRYEMGGFLILSSTTFMPLFIVLHRGIQKVNHKHVTFMKIMEEVMEM